MVKKIKNETLISVYLLNYNYAKYIEKSIKSVLNQTFKNFELIIIDDGSTDNSKKLIAKYSEHPKIRIIYQKNKGLISSSNIAIKASLGKFIIRLDADDYFDKNALSILYNEIKKDKNIGIVYPNFYEVDENNNILSIVRKDLSKTKKIKDNPGHGACCLIRKSFLLIENLYDEKFDRQDGYNLWYKFYQKYKIKYIELPLFYYRQHKNNLTKNNTDLLKTRSKIINNFYNKKKNFKNKEIVCFVPVRGPSISNNCVSLKKINKKFIIVKVINDLLKVNKIKKIIIISSDINVEKVIKKNFLTNKKVFFYRRTQKESLENTSYKDSIYRILKKLKKLPKFIILRNYEYPYLRIHFKESLINKMLIHNYDKIISVVEDYDKQIYIENKNGLKLVNNRNDEVLKLEQKSVFIQAGGIQMLKTKKFLSKNNLSQLTVGKLIIDKVSSKKYEFIV